MRLQEQMGVIKRWLIIQSPNTKYQCLISI